MNASIIQDLDNLFEKQVDCDITFFVKEQDVKAHKFVLSLRSEVLRIMINNELSYENGKIVINDPEVGAENFKEFLKYLYTDDCKIDTENVAVLLHLGHMYLAPSLLEKCVTYIQNNLFKICVLKYAELGLLYENDCSLMEKCLYFISEKNLMVYEYRLSDAKVSVELVLKIVKDCPRTNSCTEDHLFKAVFRWAEYQCSQKEIDKTSANLKVVMNDMIQYIKFDQLKPITLATIVVEHNLLSDKEALDAICKSTIRESNASSEAVVIHTPRSSPAGRLEAARYLTALMKRKRPNP